MAQIRRRPIYDMMNGIRYPGLFPAQCFREALHYQPQPNDVIICTYPKCGTTWMQNIALYIFRKGKMLEDHAEFLKCCPFIDFTGQESIDKILRPGAFKTHIPYNYLNKSPLAKYIFVLRDPKDCCVSFYHHTQGQPAFGFWDGTFDEFFELFMSGEVEYNDYFDHLLSWYPHRNDPNVFYTTYETMKRDTKDVVIKLARFLGKEFIEAIEKDNNVLNNILHFSGFDYMKRTFNSYDLTDPSAMRKILEDPNVYAGIKYAIKFRATLNVPKDLPQHHFIRKGVVGDWKNYFSADQLQRLNTKFLEKTSGLDVQNWYSLS